MLWRGFLKGQYHFLPLNVTFCIILSVSEYTPWSSEAYTAHIGGTGPRDPQVYFSRIDAETALATELSVQDSLKINNLMSFIICGEPLPTLYSCRQSARVRCKQQSRMFCCFRPSMEGSWARWSKISFHIRILPKMQWCCSFHLDWVEIPCLRELRFSADSLDLPDSADHLTVGEAVDGIESLKECVFRWYRCYKS